MSMTKEQVLAVLASAAESLRAEIESRRAGELPRRIERDLREVDELDQARAAIASWPEPATWRPIETLPRSGVGVLAHYVNQCGRGRTIRARWIAARSVESDPESEIGEYDETSDTYYDPEGWYEVIDNWPDYSAVAVTEGEITHWMPLPEPPQ